MIVSAKFNIATLFEKIDSDVSNAKRVKTSHLTQLLKGVKNSTSSISFSDFRQINTCYGRILNTLDNQRSNIHTEKKTKLQMAFIDACSRQSTDSINENKKDIKENLSRRIHYVQDHLLKKLSTDYAKAQENISKYVHELPSKDHQDKANSIIKDKDYWAFNKETAITKSLFRPTYEEVETRNGYRSQQVDNKDLSKWTVLERAGNKLLSLEKDLKIVSSILQNKDSLLSSIKVNTMGEPLLTDSQKLLNDLYNKYNH